MSKEKKMIVYGLTGSIACGKSTVTQYLKDKGFIVEDADCISRDALTIDKESINLVKEKFGCVHDGIVDRKALGKIIFHDKEAKKELEAIIHPYVIKKLKEAKERYKDEAFIFFDIPLLFEAHFEFLCDKIIVVYLNEETQLQRLMKRDHIDQEYALTIMNNQIPSSIKKQKANIVLDNNKDLNHLYIQIEKMVKDIQDENIINK